MSTFSAYDSAMMARALTLAARGRYTAHPNPMVGCVLVRDGSVIGEGWHQRAGAAHAEVNAIESAEDARGATCYVTLEPCSHHGRTPPCVNAILAAGVTTVVCAMEDPFAAVAGNGIAALQSAGVEVRTGLMQAAAEALNRGYLSRVRRGRPFVRLKVAASIDGAVAMKNGQSQWITGPEARDDVQRLRAGSGAILTGIGTVLADDPSFTVRHRDLDTGGRQPLRAILDSRLRMPRSARMLCLPGTTLVFCSSSDGAVTLQGAGAEVVTVPGSGGMLDLLAVLENLGGRDINDLLIEAGPSLAGSMLAEHLVDELVIYQAPHIMGSETISMFRTPGLTELADRQRLTITDTRRVGADLRITATIDKE